MSAIVFLNSSSSDPAQGEFGGGELVMCPELLRGPGTAEPVTVLPRHGTLVAFDASMPHEVRPVRSGTRDVIVDWYY